MHTRVTTQRPLSMTEIPFIIKSFLTVELHSFFLESKKKKSLKLWVKLSCFMFPSMRWDKFSSCFIATEFISGFHLGKKTMEPACQKDFPHSSPQLFIIPVLPPYQ